MERSLWYADTTKELHHKEWGNPEDGSVPDCQRTVRVSKRNGKGCLRPSTQALVLQITGVSLPNKYCAGNDGKG